MTRTIGLLALLAAPAALALPTVTLNPLGSYETGIFNAGGAEISTFDANSERVFTVHAAPATVDIVDISNPNAPVLYDVVDLTGVAPRVTSVSAHDEVVAVSLEADNTS